MNAQTKEDKTFDRFVDSQPILNMLRLLAETGRPNFINQEPWEICLCALILSLEPNCNVERILESLPYHHENFDEMDVLNTMAHLGYFCRRMDCNTNEIDARLLPALFIPETGVPCVILTTDETDNLIYYDPISTIISPLAIGSNNQGHVWIFQQFDKTRPATSRFMRQGSNKTWFGALLDRFHGTFAQIMASSFILSLIALLTPIFIMLIYDRVISVNSIETLPMLAIGGIIAIGFEWILRNIRSRGLSWLSGRLDNIVGNKIFSHLIGLAPSVIERASVSAQIARIKTFEAVRDFFAGSVFLSILEFPFVIVSALAMTAIAGPLVFVPLIISCCYIALFFFIRQNVKIAIRLAAKTSSARQQFTIESLEKISAIRLHGIESKWQEKFRNLSGREMLSHFHLGWLGMIAETIAHSFTVIAAVATVGFGVGLIWDGQMSTGALVACMILVWRILTPFYAACTMIPRLEQLRNSIKQVNDLMDIETEEEEAQSFAKLPQLNGRLIFENVSLQYNDEQNPVFLNLSFKADRGDLVILTGANGTGKSSVLKLIKGLYKPQSGNVMIDGFDIRQLDAQNLRHQTAYIAQQPDFFEGTLAENLRLVAPLAPDSALEEALKLAGAWEEIQATPEGLYTKIASNNKKSLISLSLLTRISIAKIYLNPSPIILIDELPNTLITGIVGDNLKAFLQRCKGKRTVIMVSYRDDYMRLADTIIWLRGNQNPEIGKREEMLEIINEQQEKAA